MVNWKKEAERYNTKFEKYDDASKWLNFLDKDLLRLNRLSEHLVNVARQGQVEYVKAVDAHRRVELETEKHKKWSSAHYFLKVRAHLSDLIKAFKKTRRRLDEAERDAHEDIKKFSKTLKI